jgi:hypothetical protein
MITGRPLEKPLSLSFRTLRGFTEHHRNATGKAAALSLLVAGLAGDDARLDENQKNA